MGKPEASTMLTASVRLGGQVSSAPSSVFDQSRARMSADIFAVEGMSGTEWCAIFLVWAGPNLAGYIAVRFTSRSNGTLVFPQSRTTPKYHPFALKGKMSFGVKRM